MRIFEILEKINSLQDYYDFLESTLTDEEKELVELPQLATTLSKLNLVMKERKKELQLKIGVLSSHMSKEKLQPQDWRKFYDYAVNQPEKVQIIAARLNSLTNFTFPILELFPGLGTFTEHVTAGEPVYIVDYYEQCLNYASAIFNEFYATRRLMKYTIDDFDLSMLPQNQFGVVFSLNLFHVKSSDFIFNWAKEILKILRPGGYFLFNFIPDDTVWGLRACETDKFTCIDVENLKSRLTKELGYEIVDINYETVVHSTMLVKKPGVITPFKLTSSLARIIEKSEPFV